MRNKQRINLAIIAIVPLLLLSLITATANNTNSQYKNNQKLNSATSASNYTIEDIEIGLDYVNNFSGAIVNDGTNDVLYMWGGNNNGQLGNGSTTPSPIPQAIDIDGSGSAFDEGQLSNLTCGDVFTGIVVNDPTNGDTLYTWGRNDFGQLGLGISTPFVKSPTKVNEPDPAINIIELVFSTTSSGAIIDNNGTDEVYTWGDNTYNQLGYEGGMLFSNPTQVVIEEPYDNISNLVNTQDQMMVIIENGSDNYLLGWGEDYFGQFGIGDSAETIFTTPELIDVNTITGIDGTIRNLTGDFATKGLVIDDGTNDHIFTAGKNNFGQLGFDGGADAQSTTWQEIPTVPLASNSVTTLNMNFVNSSCGVINNQYLYVWGSNLNGCLGLGSSANAEIKTPTLVDTGTLEGEISEVSTGGNSMLILTDDGVNQRMYATGHNPDDSLGLNSGISNYSSLQLTLIQSYNPVVDSTETTDVVNIGNDTATIEYYFDMNGAIAESVKLTDESNTTIQTDTTLDIDADGILSGFFIINDLTAGTNYTYNLVVDYQRPSIETTFSDSKVVTFTTDSGAIEIIEPSLTITNLPATSTTTSADFEVAVAPGTDSTLTPFTFVDYTVKNSGGHEVPSEQITNVGTTYTISGLAINQSFVNWTVETTWRSTTDGDISVKTRIPRFSTLPATIINPTVGNINLKSTTETTARFNITLNKGVTSNGNEWNVLNYVVYDEAGNPYPSELVNPGIINQNFIISGLDFDTDYSNWSLEINWISDFASDGPIQTTTDIPDFATIPYEIIAPTVTIELSNKTATSATFTQEITDYGQTSDSSAWLYSGEFNVYDGTTLLSDVTTETDGSFTINNLNPDTIYDSINVKSTFTNPNESDLKVTTNIDSFQTESVVAVDPTTTITFLSSKKTTATFEVVTNGGMAPSGKEWEVVSYEITDGSTIIPSENIINNGDGTWTIINLTKNTDYSLYTVEIVYADANDPTTTFAGEPIVINDFSTASSLKQYIELGAIVVITIILILVVVFIVIT